MKEKGYFFIKNIKKYSHEEMNIVTKSTDEIDYSIFKTSKNRVVSFDKLVNEGEQITVRRHTRFIDYPKHSHDYIEVNFVVSGSSTQRVDGELVELKKGDLLFLSPGIEHDISRCEEQDIMINFIINPSFFESLLTFIDAKNYLSDFIVQTVFKRETFIALVFKNLNTNKEVKSIINKIITELKNEKTNILHNSKIKFLVGLLFVELSNETPYKISKNSYNDKMILDIINYIENNLEDASLITLSEKLNLKDYNLAKFIKKNTGQTFKEIVKEIRLEKICDLLLSTDISILEIARMMGFSSSSFFYKEFNFKYGVSPKEYRDLNKS
ncbi:MAG: AraC family transcriptional regulator [Cetobacterium sp.]